MKSYFGFYVIVYFMGPHVGVDTGRMLYALEREKKKAALVARHLTSHPASRGAHFDFKS